jgi:GTP pyrophosphokinase
MELMKNLKADTYSKEVFAFTPKGDLFRLSPGSTVLDFAFHIHSNLGCRCSGAIVNSTHQKITYKIQNGDTVEILTSASQVPKQDWLNIVVSSKARNKIKQALNERRLREAELGKELLERRTRNRKIELDDTIFQKAVKKLRYKSLNDFYCDIAAERITPDRVLSIYHEIAAALTLSAETKGGADEYRLAETPESSPSASTASDILVIGDKDIKGLNYRLARCCSPIYGDEVFGFISADGVVKIHRNDCSNAPNMRARYPYRLIRVTWSGTGGSSLPATLRVTGKDDIGIVTNITSIINKEPTTTLRNITIDSHDGLFQGYLTIGVSDSLRLEAIIGKLRTVKGVKEVTRC